MADPLLMVKNLRINAGDTLIVDDVSFALGQGRVLGLIGESGAGKSTIGLAMLGYCRSGLTITGGDVLLGNQNITKLSPAALEAVRGTQVTYVAQSAASAFNPAQKLLDQVIEATVAHGLMSHAAACDRARELFALLDLPEPATFGERYPHQVSGGQLQRAMTAMALCPAPALIIFDEPTTALDVTTQVEVLAAIKTAIVQSGTSALYISHDLPVVAQIADEVMVLRHGKTVEYGDAAQIFAQPAHPYTQQLVALRQQEELSQVPSADIILRVTELGAGYRSSPDILKDIGFEIARGQTLAVVGESGSGKSTLARVVAGLTEPSNGEIFFQDKELAPSFLQRDREILRQIQMINQLPDLALNPKHTVLELIGRPLRVYFGLSRKEIRERVEAWLTRVELPVTLIDRLPEELSGGQKQRICIARALAVEPELVLCDEPTSALDPIIADDVLKLLRKLQKETRTSYLFITHDLAIVNAIADQVAVMHKGRIVRQGSKDQVLSPPWDDYTGRLMASVPEMRQGWLEETIAKTRHLQNS